MGRILGQLLGLVHELTIFGFAVFLVGGRDFGVGWCRRSAGFGLNCSTFLSCINALDLDHGQAKAPFLETSTFIGAATVDEVRLGHAPGVNVGVSELIDGGDVTTFRIRAVKEFAQGLESIGVAIANLEADGKLDRLKTLKAMCCSGAGSILLFAFDAIGELDAMIEAGKAKGYVFMGQFHSPSMVLNGVRAGAGAINMVPAA